MAAFVAVLFLILLGRFWYLQIAQGDHYRELSDANRIANIELPAPRGILRDRNGAILASTRPAFTVAILPAEVEDLEGLLVRLSQVLGRPAAELEQDYRKNRVGRFKPVPIARDVPMEVVIVLQEEQPYLPGLLIESDPIRVYPNGTLAAHLLGYVREISAEELKRLREEGDTEYRPRDIVGKIGAERLVDRYLRGKLGRQRVERDAHGNMLNILGSEAPVPGNTVTLTLDARVQKAAEEGLVGRVGAAVALDPRNGNVIAMASGPTFDPAWFTRRMDPQEYREKIGSNPHYPLINRAISSAYPPGSTFKLTSMAALYQEGKINPKSHAYCPGALRIGNMNKRCWSTHGSVDPYLALAKSCDVFFYQYGLLLCRNSPDPLADWAERFGFGHRTGIPIHGEVAGRIPRLEWHLRRARRKWYPGDAANIMIGQGDILATPLQIANMTAIFANGGTVYQPRVADYVTDPKGKKIHTFPVVQTGKVELRPEVLELVRQGVRLTVTGGTGRVVNLPQVEVAGKTGSAEHHHAKAAHAWFTCYAPYQNPTIAIAVLVEEGAHGATAAGPVARRMLEAYFGLDKNEVAPPPLAEAGD